MFEYGSVYWSDGQLNLMHALEKCTPLTILCAVCVCFVFYPFSVTQFKFFAYAINSSNPLYAFMID